MSETHSPREIHGFQLILFTIGTFGLSLSNIFIGVYLFQYYVYTINLDPILVSIGISMQAIVGAISAIIFGVMADNKKPGKFGKRKPFLMIGLPIWALMSILIFFPPWYCPENNAMFLPTAIYFWVINMIRAASGTLLMSVKASMLPEQSQTHENRAKIASINTFQMILSSIIAVFIPMTIQSMVEDPANVRWWQPSGQVIIFYAPLMGIVCAILGFILYIFTILSIDESFHDNVSKSDEKKRTFGQTFKRMIVPATDKKFRKQLAAEFFIYMAGSFYGILIIPLMTYVLLFKQVDFLIYTVVSIWGKIIGYFLFKRIYKKRGLIKSYSTCIAICIIFAFMDVVFLFNLSFEIKMIIFLISTSTLLAAFYGFGQFGGPLTSAIIVEAAVEVKGSNFDEAVSDLSGAYFGFLTFLVSIGPAIASFLLGIILSGPNKENPIIIGICFFSMGFFYMISLYFMRQIKIGKE